MVLAAQIAVTHLHDAHPLTLWLLTQVDGGQQVVIASAGTWSARFRPGTLMPWLGSLALAMAAGGPTSAPDIEQVPEYASAAAGPLAGVRGYVGVPLTRLGTPGGSDELLGCLSGFTVEAHDPRITTSVPAATVLGRLLSVVADSGREAELSGHALSAAEHRARIDSLTGLSNRRGWDAALLAGNQHGGPAGVVAIDLDGLKDVNDSHGHAVGDDQLRRAGNALRAACRPDDVVSRPGGDEFAVLALGVDLDDLLHLRDRLERQLGRSEVAASLGVARREPGEDLADTWRRADLAMYEDKRGRRVLRGVRAASTTPGTPGS